MLFAPSMPELEAVASHRQGANQPSAPVAAAVRSPVRSRVRPADDTSTLPQPAAPTELADAIPEKPISLALPLTEADSPVYQQEAVADPAMARDVMKTTEDAVHVKVPSLAPRPPSDPEIADDAYLSIAPELAPPFAESANVPLAATQTVPLLPAMFPNESDYSHVRSDAELAPGPEETAKVAPKMYQLVPVQPNLISHNAGDEPVESVMEPAPRFVETVKLAPAAPEPWSVQSEMTSSHADDQSVSELAPRFVRPANLAPAATQEPRPVSAVTVLRPPNTEIVAAAGRAQPPGVEKAETRVVRLEPPITRPNAQSADSGGQKASVRIGSLEVRIVNDARTTPTASQPQAARPAPVRTTAQAQIPARLSRGFRGFGLVQG
jgi:hypothetical protein